MSQLISLHLSRGEIKEIPENAFIGLDSLETLFLFP